MDLVLGEHLRGTIVLFVSHGDRLIRQMCMFLPGRNYGSL